jgi:hypothetical protein
MFAVAEDLEISFREDGQTTEVPNDDFAKLSYYLSCISSCLPDVIEDDLTRYQNYRYMSDQTKAKVLVTACLLTPTLLEGKAMKKVSIAEMSRLSPGFSNQFFRLTERRNLGMVGIDDDVAIMVESKRVRVTKIMIYNQNWVNKYYNEPIIRIAEAVDNAKNGRRALPYNSGGTDSYVPAPNREDRETEEGAEACLVIMIFLICVIFGPIGLLFTCLCCGAKCTGGKVRAALIGAVINITLVLVGTLHGTLYSYY